MRFTVFITCLFLSTLALGQSGYQIKFQVTGLKDTTIYLGNYFGESTYLKDTAKVNSKGEFVFEGKKKLERGAYFLVLNKMKVMEMVVGSDQHFSMVTSTEDYVKNMKVTGDVDNKLYFDNMLFNMERHHEAEPFIKVLQDSTLAADKKTTAREAYNKVGDKVTAYQQDIIKKYPRTITAATLKSVQILKVPDAPKKPDGSMDSTFQLRWYRQHFFDNFDLADSALLRMSRPLYRDKVFEYLEKLYAPNPDTVTKAIGPMVDKAKSNKETYKYITFILLMKYQQPEIMGLDEVYVNVFDKYFGSGEMDFWVPAKTKKDLKEHADRLRKSLVGRKAPNLIMQDTNFKPKSMYDIKNKYTILFIFDPDCGHCREETPKLVTFYNQKKYNLEVYAVSADTSMAKMRDYIKEMKMPWITVNGPRTYVGPYGDLYDAITTPSLYVIDEKKMIIGKKIPVEKLDEFLTQYEKFHKTKPAEKGKPTTKS